MADLSLVAGLNISKHAVSDAICLYMCLHTLRWHATDCLILRSAVVGIESELTKNLAGDVALTAQYTKSWTKATSAGATIPIGPGEFGTATKGKLHSHYRV